MLENIRNAITRLPMDRLGRKLGGHIPSCPGHVATIRLPWSPGLEQSATGGHISAITGHLSQASEDSSVHRVIFEHTTIVTD